MFERDDPQATVGRRQFLGGLAGLTAGAVGAVSTVAGQAGPVVTMDNNYFDPVGLHVEPGTTVRFEIAAGAHSATAYHDRIPSEAEGFDSGVISAGGFEHTFETPGTYDYYCRPHRDGGMVGRLVVGEPGGPAEASAIPDGSVPDSETIVAEGTVAGDRDGAGGMMDGHGGHRHDHGVMPRRGAGWMLLMPVGLATAVIGAVGAAVYWLGGRQ